MKKFIATMMVLALVGFVAAQDLDSPTMGAPVDNPAADNNGGIYDMLVARMLKAEADFISGREHEGLWLAWGIGSDFDRLAGFGKETGAEGTWWLRKHAAGEDDVWAAFDEARDMLDDLSAAERAAFNQEFMESRGRMIAAGLN